MSVSPADFLSSANSMKDGATEIDFRNCISRAYYSMFHSAMPIADQHFPDCHSNNYMGAHERLSKRFHAAATKGAKSVAYQLESMKRERRRADYDLLDSVNEFDAKQALSNARGFSALLAKCIANDSSVPAGAFSASPATQQ